MLERFKRSSSTNDAPPRDKAPVATAERPADEPAEERGIRRDSESTRDETAAADDRTATRDDRTAVHDDRSAVHDDRTAFHDDRDDRTLDDERAARRDDRSARRMARTGNGAATASALATARARQRDEYGGINWGASFFGWLVAVGIAALLTGFLAAAGAAIGLISTSDATTENTEEIGLGGGIALVVVLMLAYYAGGYVAGRMSRFDGARQGIGTWVIGLIVTIGLAVAAVVLGDEYNVLEQLNLPSLPVGDQTLATGGIIALVAIVLGTILAAMFGGKVGERYHKRVDRAGFID